MDREVIAIGYLALVPAYVFVLLLLAIVRWRGIAREQEILLASVRMTLQLVLVGYILAVVFEHDHPLLTLVILAVMLTFAIYNIYQRVKLPLGRRLRRVIALAMLTGTTVALAFFLFVVVRLEPWYSSRYFIPIGGMIIGNSMTGIALGVNHLVQGIQRQWAVIESSLMLGAEPRAAVKQVVNEAFDAAILPTINSMVGMGIVFLPGMMTGQILSGTDPTTAIQYQIAIMLGILGAVSLTVILFVHYGSQTFFNHQAQLIWDSGQGSTLPGR